MVSGSGRSGLRVDIVYQGAISMELIAVQINSCVLVRREHMSCPLDMMVVLNTSQRGGSILGVSEATTGVHHQMPPESLRAAELVGLLLFNLILIKLNSESATLRNTEQIYILAILSCLFCVVDAHRKQSSGEKEGGATGGGRVRGRLIFILLEHLLDSQTVEYGVGGDVRSNVVE